MGTMCGITCWCHEAFMSELCLPNCWTKISLCTWTECAMAKPPIWFIPCAMAKPCMLCSFPIMAIKLHNFRNGGAAKWTSLEHRVSVLDFVSKLWSKIRRPRRSSGLAMWICVHLLWHHTLNKSQCRCEEESFSLFCTQEACGKGGERMQTWLQQRRSRHAFAGFAKCTVLVKQKWCAWFAVDVAWVSVHSWAS